MEFCKESLLGISLACMVHAQTTFDPAGPEFHINTFTTSGQESPCIAMANDGGFAVIWHSNGQDGDGYGIFGQRFSSSGAKNGSEFQVNTYTANNQSTPGIARVDNSSFAVVWQSLLQEDAGLQVLGPLTEHLEAGGGQRPLRPGGQYVGGRVAEVELAPVALRVARLTCPRSLVHIESYYPPTFSAWSCCR